MAKLPKDYIDVIVNSLNGQEQHCPYKLTLNTTQIEGYYTTPVGKTIIHMNSGNWYQVATNYPELTETITKVQAEVA